MLKILLFVALVAITVYLVTAAMQRQGSSSAPTLGRRQRPRPVAPDDDPDFLRQLDEDQWRKRRQRDADPD